MRPLAGLCRLRYNSLRSRLSSHTNPQLVPSLTVLEEEDTDRQGGQE